MYTTASNYPWYKSRSPLAINISSGDSEIPKYTYRYSIHRAGVFYRWEEPSDRPELVDEKLDQMEEDGAAIEDIRNSNLDSQMDDEEEEESTRHELPLGLLASGEEYIVNDVLGVTNPAHPDIEHIRVQHSSEVGDVKLLHSTSRNDSFNGKKSTKSGSSLNTMGGSSSHLNKETTSKKKVGFAPEPPAYHEHHAEPSGFGVKRDPVHLDSTDGLIVASVFLPVHLHRSRDGRWSADWDYEALLSMQTHLRVTRVGVVKWRGWHGNKGADGSPEGGVPENERHLVEECLRPFHCVPVWVEPSLFGEM